MELDFKIPRNFDLGLEFWILGIDAVGYRLPGGYTVEWFRGDFYMWFGFVNIPPD